MGKALFWHRRDLRIHDNAGLYKALKSTHKVQAVFIFDTTILKKLPGNDQRVVFIHQQVTSLKSEYEKEGSDLLILHGDPLEILPRLVEDMAIDAVFTNRDYEPQARDRDRAIVEQLKAVNCVFFGAKDQVIFEKSEVVKVDNTPYTVYTPYMKKWREKLNDFYLKPYPVEKYIASLIKSEKTIIPSLSELGFGSEQFQDFPPDIFPKKIVSRYAEQRDFPAIDGTSRLSLHLRFGTISIRELVQFALEHNETYLKELIWRDFYQMILFHFPQTVNEAFRKQYDRIEWEYNEEQFTAWCEGKTGYPLVDAGMRELNATGFMHNRVRMVVASFLTKHLLHDWRLGERYFAEKLLDFELASNVGGWQWAAGSGNDAAPYFRVFNPTSQQQKFDPKFEYIKKWVPEFGTNKYPEPIVEHTFARNRVLERYKKALNN